MKEKTSHYDKFAQDFSSTRAYAWEEFDIVKSKIWKGDRVLDLGCGNGRFRQFLGTTKVAPGAYFGFDLSEYAE